MSKLVSLQNLVSSKAVNTGATQNFSLFSNHEDVPVFADTVPSEVLLSLINHLENS